LLCTEASNVGSHAGYISMGKQVSEITVKDERLHLHAFKDQQLTKDCFSIKYSDVQTLLSSTSALAFIDLTWPDHPCERLYLRIDKSTHRGKQFINLITGDKGSSYIGCKFCYHGPSENRGEPEEYIMLDERVAPVPT
ncbi:unnamed protein product, partial [Meganyctiphanes norvegica]